MVRKTYRASIGSGAIGAWTTFIDGFIGGETEYGLFAFLRHVIPCLLIVRGDLVPGVLIHANLVRLVLVVIGSVFIVFTGAGLVLNGEELGGIRVELG